MHFQHNGTLKYLTCESLESAPLVHAIFTRQGGVSPQPWDSLNFGSTVGDDLNNVVQNRQRAFDCLGLDHASTFDVWQVHSADVVLASAPRAPEVKHQKADIILTSTPGLVLLMRFADCVPLLFYDPQHHVAGIAHAGWQGTVKGVATAAVDALRANYHTNPADLLAFIGPSIGPDHYQVGPEVVEQVQAAFGGNSQAVIRRLDGHAYFDLWSANHLHLEQAGVKSIEIAEICTACNLRDWYSHRGQHGQAGRFGALIGLKG